MEKMQIVGPTEHTLEQFHAPRPSPACSPLPVLFSAHSSQDFPLTFQISGSKHGAVYPSKATEPAALIGGCRETTSTGGAPSPA